MRVLRPGVTGSDVMEMQAMLAKLAYDPGPADGVFGPRTQAAVSAFQRDFGLVPDGIVGANARRAMERFLLGYDIYTIRQGDTLYGIAQRYGIRLPLLIAANPDADPQRLAAGQRITVPYGFDVVDTNIGYTYAVLQRDVQGLAARYPFIETGTIGSSVLGKNLYYIRLGIGARTVLYNAAHHALEWITSPVLMKFAEEYAKACTLRQRLGGYSPCDLWDDVSIYIVPMVNPDGVDLVIDGLQPGNPYAQQLIRWNNGSAEFSRRWQANIRGVDLNHNYNANWEESVRAAEALGITGPGPTRYSGPFPVSEPETRAMVDFTGALNPRLVMAYHSQGEVIFWDFKNLAPPEARTIGQRLSALSGYALAAPEGIASYAGYKDWFIQDYRRPGYTIEVGRGQNPLPIMQFNAIYADNLPMLLYAATVY
jgi:g-D-glutamyl-meso-diaminopimelate peptidase